MEVFDFTVLEGFILAFLRTGTALALMPVFGYGAVPLQVKAGVGFILAVTLAPTAAAQAASLPPGALPALSAAAGEVLTGMVIGMVAALILVGAEFAGTILGYQMGFAIVSVFDPTLERPVSIIGQLQYYTALIVFILLDFHHGLLAALGESFAAIPLGGGPFPGAVATDYAKLTAAVFVIAVKLAAPVMAMILISEIGLGFIARTMPQMNVFIVGFPIKIGLGLLGLAVSWPLFVYVISKVFIMFERELAKVIETMGVIL